MADGSRFLRDLGEGRAAVLRVASIGGPERKLGEVHKPWLSFFPLTWAPDGDSLVIVDRESATGPQVLFALSVESGERRRLTSPPALTRGDNAPAFSPDGRTIAFVRTVDHGSADLYLLPVGEGLRAVSEPKRLTSGRHHVNNPAWGSQGREIIFSEGVQGPNLRGSFGDLWRVAVTGASGPQRLAVGDNAFGLSFSQQRHRLVYSRGFLIPISGVWRSWDRTPSHLTLSRLSLQRETTRTPRFHPMGRESPFTRSVRESGQFGSVIPMVQIRSR